MNTAPEAATPAGGIAAETATPETPAAAEATQQIVKIGCWYVAVAPGSGRSARNIASEFVDELAGEIAKVL